MISTHKLLIILIAFLYIAAIFVAILRRKIFPLTESLAMMGIAGVIFTSLVFVITLPVKSAQMNIGATPAELAFCIGYFFVVAILLLVKPRPVECPDRFWRLSWCMLLSTR